MAAVVNFRQRMWGHSLVWLALLLTGAIGGKALYDTRQQMWYHREMREVTEAILESDDFGYGIIDDQFRVVQWNKAFERITGWTEEELRADPNGFLVALPPGPEADEQNAWLREQFAADHIHDSEVRMFVFDWPNNHGVTRTIVTVRVVETERGKRYAIGHAELVGELQKAHQRIIDEHPEIFEALR